MSNEGLKPRLLIVFAFLTLTSTAGAWKNRPEKAQEPQLLSAFPLGGSRGSTFTVKVRGLDLEDLSGVWFECQDLMGRVVGIRKLERDKAGEEEDYYVKKKRALMGLEEDRPEFEVLLEITASKEAEPGLHFFRLVTPRGMSNSLTLHIVGQEVVAEQQAPHQQAWQAQSLQVPVVVDGIISEKGERDFYAFS